MINDETKIDRKPNLIEVSLGNSGKEIMLRGEIFFVYNFQLPDNPC